MILTGSEIIHQIRTGAIKIVPFDEDFVNPNSYNYRLGNHLMVYTNKIDAKGNLQTKKIIIPEEGYVLTPGILYLGYTFESIGSDTFVPSLIGRSSLGRLGLFLQITADLGHLGTFHKWTLEMKTVQPLRIYPGMKIGQVSFWSTVGRHKKSEGYSSKNDNYAHYSEAAPSQTTKFFE